MSDEIKIIHTTGRNNCGGRCIIHAHVRDGKILRLTTDTQCGAGSDVPLTACARGMNYHKTFLNEDRLRYPMKRVGPRGEGKFVRISWDEAVDTIAREWIRIRDTYGPGSRYVNYSTGVSAVFRPDDLAMRLLSLDGGFLSYYNSYSSACIRQTSILMYGTGNTGNAPEDWLNSNLIILWGHNPAATKFDCETMYYLRKARDKGIPIVVVDPRENETVRQLKAEWIPIRPATDSAMLDAMAWVLVQEGLVDHEFLDRCCIGFDPAHMPLGVDPGESVLSYLTGEQDGVPKTPEWAEAITGVSAAVICDLAIRYATARPSILYQGWGPQRNAYGEQCVRGGILLACMTGNVGIHGGYACGAGDYAEHKRPSLPMPKNPYPYRIPVFLWTDAILRGTEMGAADGVRGGEHPLSNIKMILNLAGNTLINQHGDINRTKAILEDESKCEFIVCSDLFMTASAKFADILLPGISMFECDNLTNPWQYGEFLGCCNKVIEPLYEGRFEYEWLSEVAERLGLRQAFTEGRTHSEWLEYIYSELQKSEPELPDYAVFKETGIYRYKERHVGVAFDKECADPERYPFPTPSGKIELYSDRVNHLAFRDPFPPIPRYVAPPEGPQDPLTQRYPLQLVGWHTPRRCHSIHDNNLAMHAIDPQALWMHPVDAASRGICEGDMVLVFNDRGKTRIPAHLTERIMQGVTALSQGAWYDADEEGVDRGGSINVLTSSHPTPYAHGNGQHTNLVEVKRLS